MAYSRQAQRAELDRMVARMVAEQEAIMREHDGTSSLTSFNVVPSNRMRDVKVTADNWTTHYWRDSQGRLRSRKTRVVGTDVTVTYADGTTETRSPGSFRKTTTKTRSKRSQEISELRERNLAARERLNDLMQAHAIGNID